MKIMILDDDKELLAALRRILEGNGHEVEVVDNAKDAVPMAEKGEYDLLLVDYKMPENDGMWFMKNVRLPKKSRVLLITAFVNRDVINRMFELGASGYLIKPFDEQELLRHIEFYCSPAPAP